MKKGFTLIELLAVIVILAIIALIATPIVLNIIDDSKESSLLRSAEFYLDAVEYTIADTFLYHEGLPDGKYPITKDGDICKVALDSDDKCSEGNTLEVEVNGDKPIDGTLEIKNGEISIASINIDEKTLVKSFFDESFVLIGDVNEDGIVNKTDAIKLSRALMYSEEISSLRNGDMNNDRKITVTDINLLSIKVGKVIVTDANGVGIIGDVDGNGIIEEAEKTLLIRYIDGFRDQFVVISSADINGDGEVKIFDSIRFLQVISETYIIEY